MELLPSVHHYSWFNLPRKIKTYRDYWSQHWQSLYNIPQDDTAENNMFFQKPWSEVSDEDIESLSTRLKNEIGGWIFHSPVDFSNPTPHISLELDHPKFVWTWLGREEEQQIEISSHYSGYLEKQEADIIAFKRDENLSIPDNIDYDQFSGLSNEVKAKFKEIRPKTMGQALRIDGITPAAVYILLSHLKRKSIKHIA